MSNPVTSNPTPELKPNEVQAFKDGQLNLNWRDYLPLGADGKPIKFDDVPACCTYTREALAEAEGIETDGNGQRVKRGLFSGLFSGKGKPSPGKGTNGGGLGNALSRVDWQKVFVRTASLMAVAAVAFLAFQYLGYFTVFGAGALAMIGQFTIGLFFMFSITNATSGLQVMTSALGMFLLVNSF